jgi:hypothetical protein
VREVNNSTILRIIGQDLQSRDIKAFSIRCEGDRFSVQGSSQNPPCPTPLTFEYSAREIYELNRERGQKREELPASRDFFTLTQILRAIGAYIDNRGGRLLRISNNDSNASDLSFRIEYESADGSRVIDDRNGAAIYDMCVRMYKLRGKAKGKSAISERAGRR